MLALNPHQKEKLASWNQLYLSCLSPSSFNPLTKRSLLLHARQPHAIAITLPFHDVIVKLQYNWRHAVPACKTQCQIQSSHTTFFLQHHVSLFCLQKITKAIFLSREKVAVCGYVILRFRFATHITPSKQITLTLTHLYRILSYRSEF
jgi:hypothetical protein